MVAKKFPMLILFALALTLLSAGFTACQTTMTAAPLTQTSNTVEPTSTSQPPSPEPATAVPALANKDLATVLNGTQYEVAPDGNAVITYQNETGKAVKVEISQGKEVLTDDGLAKDIKTGYDKDGNRFIYVENYGWVRDIDLSKATIENPLEVPWELASHQETLNTIFALHYAENPTISPNAVEPHYWINVSTVIATGIDDIYLGLQSNAASPNDVKINRDKLATKFGSADQPFSKPKALKSVNPQGQNFTIFGGTFKNPTQLNKNQKINLFKWMGKDRYDKLVELPGNYMMNMAKMINDNTSDMAPVLVPPLTIDGVSIPWNPGIWQDMGKFGDPTVAGLQKPGELLSLFGDQQNDILKMIAFFHGGPVFGDGHTFSKLIDHIPEEFALHPLLFNQESWTYPPGK